MKLAAIELHSVFIETNSFSRKYMEKLCRTISFCDKQFPTGSQHNVSKIFAIYNASKHLSLTLDGPLNKNSFYKGEADIVSLYNGNCLCLRQIKLKV